MTTTQIRVEKRLVAGALPLVGAGLLMNGIGGHFSVLWLAVTGLAGLYLTGNLDDLKQRFSFKGYGLGILLSIGIFILTLAINFFFNHSATANPVASYTGNYLLLIITVLVPSLIGEELYTLTLYRAAGSGLTGVVVSTVLFAGMHGFEYHWNILQLLSLVAIRLVFTYIMLKYSVQTSAALHITYDTLLFSTTIL